MLTNMNRLLLLAACLSLCLSISCDGCRRKEGKRWNPNDPLVTVAEETKRQLSRRERAQLLLQMIPASSQALVVLDLQRLFRLAGELQAALGHTTAGADLVQRARQATAGAPIKVPLGEADLAGLGLDSRGVAAVFGVGRPEVFVLPVKDDKTFLARVAAALGQKGKAWRTEQKGGRLIHGLPGARCHLAGGQATCAASGEKLLAALDQRRQRSLWDALPRDLRVNVERATALFSVEHQGGRATGSLRVEADGLSLDVRVKGGATTSALSRLAGAGERSLLGLARRAESVLCLRLDPAAVLGAMPALAPRIKALGLEPDKVAAALTGEVLVVEQPQRSPVLLLGSKDRAVATTLVKAAARELGRLGRGPKGRGKPTLRVTRVKDGAAASFDVRVAPRKGQPGQGSRVRLTAAAGAILVGQPEAVAALVPIAGSPPPPAAFTRTLGPAWDRAAFGTGLVLASRSLIREPFASLPGPAAVEQMIGAGQFPDHIKQGFTVLRFLYDQLHHQTLGVVRQGAGVRLVLRLTTLHRHGHAVDDRARAIYIKGLAAKHAGDPKAYGQALRLLKMEYMGTRYGGLLRRRPGGLSGPVVALGAAAAVLLPIWAGQARQDGRTAGPR